MHHQQIGDPERYCAILATEYTGVSYDRGAPVPMIRIVEARPLGGHWVQLTLSDGQVTKRDLEPLLGGPVFDQIRSYGSRFDEMRVEGGTLVWPGGADLCPDVLIWGGLPPTGS